MADVTVLIPVLRERRNNDWLKECLQGFGEGVPYIVAENDGELAEAMNEALAAVETEWVLPFGHDDVPMEDMVDRLLAVSSDADVVYPSMLLTDEELKPLGMFNADVFCGNRLQEWNFVPGGFIGRTELVRRVGGWRDLETLEDWDLHVRMYRAGGRFKPCPQAVFAYRQVQGSRNKQENPFPTIRELREHWQERIVGDRPEPKATFYFQATPATSYWRCVLPARHLPGIATSDLAGAPRDEGGVDFVSHHGAAVFQFAADNERAAAVLAMKAQGIRVLVETDDNYLDTGDALVRSRAGWALDIRKANPSGDRDRWNPHSVEGHRWICEHADGVIVTTPTLADVYRNVNRNIFLCPNQIDPVDWPSIDEKPDDGVFRIGWFASQSHDRDAPLVRKALSWASRQPDVEIVNIGLDPGWDFHRVQALWSDDFSWYRRHLLMLDVGVAPIVHTSWSVHRSDLKILEYAMAGAVTIASSAPPYDWWRDKPALFAATEREFDDRIRWCVKHRDEARELGRQARELVLKERTVAAQIRNWEDAIRG